jgi:hypothetical protein
MECMIYSIVAEETNAKLNFSIELEKEKKIYFFVIGNRNSTTQLLKTIARNYLYTHS